MDWQNINGERMNFYSNKRKSAEIISHKHVPQKRIFLENMEKNNDKKLEIAQEQNQFKRFQLERMLNFYDNKIEEIQQNYFHEKKVFEDKKKLCVIEVRSTVMHPNKRNQLLNCLQRAESKFRDYQCKILKIEGECINKKNALRKEITRFNGSNNN